MDNTADMVEVQLEDAGLTEQLEVFRRLRGISQTERLRVDVPAVQLSLF